MNQLGYFIYMDKKEQDRKVNEEKKNHLEGVMPPTYKEEKAKLENPENIGGVI